MVKLVARMIKTENQISSFFIPSKWEFFKDVFQRSFERKSYWLFTTYTISIEFADDLLALDLKMILPQANVLHFHMATWHGKNTVQG